MSNRVWVRTGDGSSESPARRLRHCFAMFATGVAVVTALAPNGVPLGLTVNSFSSVSLEPPLLQWGLARRSRSLPSFAKGAPFAVSVLAAHQGGIARQFSRAEGDRFAGVPWIAGENGVPRLEGALAWLECRVASHLPGGDHVLILGEVGSFALGASAQPLLFFAGRFHGSLSPLVDPGLLYGEAAEWEADVWRV